MNDNIDNLNNRYNEEIKNSIMSTERRNTVPNILIRASSSSITSKRDYTSKETVAVVKPAIHHIKRKSSMNKSKTTKKIEKSKFYPKCSILSKSDSIE